ncbi:RHS repeat domain-containing protein [Lusitaniella coriacea]|uniref:RHS repeat domain-containing protein n=1 Tax=Lusitaniella coriacea TaxID=1983105 RepID=UPI003CF76447
METVTEDNETTRYIYDLAGNLKETQFPNGTVERRTYDELNRLDVLETVKNGTLLSRFDYTTNDAGHRLEVIESVLNPTTNLLEERTVRYEYDDLYRLISEEVVGGNTTTYTYDDVGNRLSKTVNGVTTTYTYDENDRLRTEVSGGDTIVYDYDDNGNLTERKENGVVTATYVWDDQNRMVQAQTDAGTVTYKYDDDNIRVSETTASGTKSYVLDKNRPYAQVLAEYEDGTEVASYTYGLDLIEQERDGNESYYSVDGLGSTRGLTDESGTVTDTYVYDAFGNVVGVVGTTENDYLFAGEQFDGTLGQYYLRQRYYDASTGRFTRRDTYEGSINDPVSLHKYIYANADPVNGIDPSGLFTLAEVQAARSIRNALAAAQAESYSQLVNATLEGEDYDPLSGIFSDILLSLFLAGFAVTIPFIGKLGRKTISAHRTVATPTAIAYGARQLSPRIKRLLKGLDKLGDTKIVKKSDINQADLARITAATGDEFAIFTRGPQRMIMRGNKGSVPIGISEAKKLRANGWKWSFHSHPGGSNVLRSSKGDRTILRAFQGKRSTIVNSKGEYKTFTPEGDYLGNWTP